VLCGPIPRVGEAFDRLAPLAYGYEADDLLDDAAVDRAGNVTAVTVPWAVAGQQGPPGVGEHVTRHARD
jgi:hypothetical protein